MVLVRPCLGLRTDSGLVCYCCGVRVDGHDRGGSGGSADGAVLAEWFRIEHLSSVPDGAGYGSLKALAAQCIVEDQGELD